MKNLLLCLLLVGCSGRSAPPRGEPTLPATEACPRMDWARYEALDRLACVEAGGVCAYENNVPLARVEACEAAYAALEDCALAPAVARLCSPPGDGGL